MAEVFINAGAHFVAIDFNNVTEIGGSIFPMVDQVRRAVAWVYRNAKSFGGDPARVYVTGHSSGGHLAELRRHHRLGKGGPAAGHRERLPPWQRHV